MHALPRSDPIKSTTVRSKYCPAKLAKDRWVARETAPAVDGGKKPAKTVPERPVRADSPSDRFERLLAAFLATIVAGYAAAVVIRVILAYGA